MNNAEIETVNDWCLFLELLDNLINTLPIHKVPPFVDVKDSMLSWDERRGNLGKAASLLADGSNIEFDFLQRSIIFSNFIVLGYELLK